MPGTGELLPAVDDAEDGLSGDLIAEIEPLLLSFGEALGGDPGGLADLPFFGTTAGDAVPVPSTVQRDPAVLARIRGWLSAGDHAVLVSQSGVGRTAVRGFVRHDLDSREEFVVATLPTDTTPRGLYERVLRAGYDAGYEIDTGNYWQVADGVPWATDETEDAAVGMARAIADDATPVLAFGDVDDVPPDLFDPIETVADAGVRLFATGLPGSHGRLLGIENRLSARVRYYEGITTLSPGEIERYVARSLADVGGGDDQSLFTEAAIEDVHERTGGHPRAVRRSCLDLFVRAASLWDHSTADPDRITITPALRERELDN